MMPWFIWKNKNSYSDFGLWIKALPDRVRPTERYEEIEIPGRAGSLIMLEGDDVYASYQMRIVVWARNTLNINEITKWLTGSGELIICTDESKIIEARAVDNITFSRVGNNLMQGTLLFLCKPLRKNRYSASDYVSLNENGTIFNPGDVASRPKVAVTGTGTLTVAIGGEAMSFSGVNGTILVDCDANIITSSGQMWEGSFSGDFWKIPVGKVSVDVGTALAVQIEPEWRWL